MSKQSKQKSTKQNMSKTPIQNTTQKDEADYETLRAKGLTHDKAMEEVNKPAGTEHRTLSGGKAPQYDDCTKAELHKMASERGISNAEGLEREDLLQALLNHKNEE